MPIFNKFGRVVTYYKKLWSIKLHNTSITWSYENIWQTESVISSLVEEICAPL